MTDFNPTLGVVVSGKRRDSYGLIAKDIATKDDPRTPGCGRVPSQSLEAANEKARELGWIVSVSDNQ